MGRHKIKGEVKPRQLAAHKLYMQKAIIFGLLDEQMLCKFKYSTTQHMYITSIQTIFFFFKSMIYLTHHYVMFLSSLNVKIHCDDNLIGQLNMIFQGIRIII